MNVDLAAQQVGCSKRSLYYWMADGTLPYTTTANGSRQVQIEDVRQLTAKRKTAVAALAVEKET